MLLSVRAPAPDHRPMPSAFGARPARGCRHAGHSLCARAITKEKKAQIIERLQEKLKSSMLVYGISYDGATVKQMEGLRRSLPESSEVVVTKNRLLRVAVDNLDEELAGRWEGLRGQKGQNAYVFAEEEGIRDTAKAYSAFFKSMKDAQPAGPKDGPAPPPPTVVRCVVMDGQVVETKDFATLEKIPTKLELIVKIAQGIKANPRKIALGVKAVPTRLAFGIKALSEMNDDKTMTVEEAYNAKKAAE